MKTVADSAIPFLRGVLEPYGEVVYLDGTAISPRDVADADVLITRTRTRCDASLLEGSRISLIATATIGTDHIDIPWCADHGITVVCAAGCNSLAVADYVIAALDALRFIRPGRTLGIIGVGNVGSKVEDMARHLGLSVLLHDPPREAAEGPGAFCSLEHLLSRSDAVTLHVPLDDSTRGMAGSGFFSRMAPGAVFINCSRGEVVDEKALKAAAPKLGPLVIDTWCHEPDIDEDLLRLTSIATPHIAGYSIQGKMNGTAAAVRAVARHFGIGELEGYTPKGWTPPVKLCSEISEKYPIFADDALLREAPGSFEKLRKSYSLRDEFYI